MDCDCVSRSAVTKEKEKLVELKVELKHLREDDEVKHNAAAQAMSARLAKMLNNLEKQIASAEVTIGDKLQKLDKDKDGVLSTEEISSALSQYLKGGNAVSTKKIIDMLDADKDRKVAVKSLDQIAEDPDEEAEDKEKEKERLKDLEEDQAKAQVAQTEALARAQAQAAKQSDAPIAPGANTSADAGVSVAATAVASSSVKPATKATTL